MRKRALVLAFLMFVGPFGSLAPLGWLLLEEGVVLTAYTVGAAGFAAWLSVGTYSDTRGNGSE